MGDVLSRLRSALAGRYTLERELGHGGMATVWLAHDLKHHRCVALKVLRPELAAALGPERFLREITVTAGLQHPHILPLLDSGEAAGQLFYVMPYVEGESLRDRLNRERQLPIEDALQISRDVADALSYAHSHDVVHRDIKPENILLESGHAVLADFGIAKALTAAGAERLTETGIAVGTPAYMSPEQGVGSGEVDARSDLYSLGCVLYEMLSGETPYTGPTPQAILAKKASGPVPRISVVRETVPALLEAALTKVLAKAPADRFATAAQLRQALAVDTTAHWRRRRRFKVRSSAALIVAVAVALGAGSVAVARYRAATGWKRVPLDPGVVVVMPFRVAGSDPGIAQLSEGVIDLLYPLLAGDGGLRSVAPNALLLALDDQRRRGRALRQDASLELAARFGAGRLIEGGIVQAGPQVTINGWMRRVPGGEEIARYSVSGGLDTVHTLVTQLALGLLGAQLGENRDRLDAIRRQAPATVAAYLTGVRALRDSKVNEAVEAFDRALHGDSTFALAALRLFTALDLSAVRPGWAALRTAHAHRNQLGPRERAELDFYRILWNVDTTGFGAATLDAARRWAEAAPDNPDALLEYASRLAFFAALLGLPSWEEKMRSAWRRAWNLDSTTPGLVVAHLRLSLGELNNEWARRVAPRLLAVVDSSNEGLLGLRWAAAQLVGDTGAARRLARRAASASTPGAVADGLWMVMRASFALALPLETADSILETLRKDIRTRADSVTVAVYLTQGGLARGRLAEAATTAAGPLRTLGPWGPAMILNWWLGHLGLDSAAARAAEELRRTASANAGAYGAACYVALYRAARGDTLGTRETSERLMIRYRRDARPGLCPAMVEAFVESHDPGRTDTPSLDRFEAILRQAAFPERHQVDEFLGTAGPLVLARLRRQRGQFDRALAASRIHLAGHFYWWYQVPLAREEGDLALLLGDTAGAVRAYTRYLALRTDPDSGPVRREREWVKTTLDGVLRARE